MSEPEVRKGEFYRIVSGDGSPLIGRAVELRESSFGHRHVLIATPNTNFWKRWIDVEHVPFKDAVENVELPAAIPNGAHAHSPAQAAGPDAV